MMVIIVVPRGGSKHEKSLAYKVIMSMTHGWVAPGWQTPGFAPSSIPTFQIFIPTF